MGTKRKKERETILLVDDELELLTIMAQVLESKGFEILSAFDPESALALAQAHAQPIHLLVADMFLPGMLGTELAQKLASTQPSMAKLFISGDVFPASRADKEWFLPKRLPWRS